MNSTAHSKERSFAAVLGSILGNVQDIVRSEISLAKAEVRDEVSAMTRGATWLALGILSAFFASAFLLAAMFFGLIHWVPTWAAAAILGVALAALCAVSLAVRRGKIVNQT
jgi:Putative Actinobacterial Holin-X, holin superfamily III